MRNFFSFALAVAFVGGCSSDGRSRVTGTTGGKMNPDLSASMVDLSEPPLPTSDGGVVNPDDAGEVTHDPTTCDEAAMSKSYIGCDYWPTVNFNPVWSVFDYAVVISNPGMTDAHVIVTGGALPTPSPTPTPYTVAPGQLVKIGLPWVKSLKGADSDATGAAPVVANSVYAAAGAYHLVSDVPVLAYQFNALEYKPGASGNDLNGVAWSTCPGTGKRGAPPCFSYSNDASLLLPSTAMTGNYIITGVHGDQVTVTGIGPSQTSKDGPHATITATANNTTVTVKLGAKASVLASTDGKIAAAAAGSVATYMLNAGDVLELVAGQTGNTSDLSGSQIQANNPVQVISGHACMTNPQTYTINELDPSSIQYSCDHVEETQLPFETWGKSYVVNSPTGPGGTAVAQTVRIYGGATTANLTFMPAVTGAPTSVAPGAVAEFDAAGSFSVVGDNEFAVGVIQKSGQIVDPNATNGGDGDPSLSFISAVEQYRDRYIFLAPSDYDTSYADVVVPTGTALTLDGVAVTTAPTAINANYGVVRIKLTVGANGGSHVLTGSTPFGLQVEGYGAQTSYQYPAGLDLKVITQPPPPIS